MYLYSSSAVSSPFSFEILCRLLWLKWVGSSDRIFPAFTHVLAYLTELNFSGVGPLILMRSLSSICFGVSRLHRWSLMCDRMLKARSTSAPTLYAFRTRIITIVLGQFAGGTFRRKAAKNFFIPKSGRFWKIKSETRQKCRKWHSAIYFYKFFENDNIRQD